MHLKGRVEQKIREVSAERIRRDLFYLCKDPLPFRKVNYTRPGRAADSLSEADGYIRAQLVLAGCTVDATNHDVQAFRCDETKPLHHWYSTPQRVDPWYEAANIEVTMPGAQVPEEIIQLISHKDSMSWIDSPGAHDNGTGTVANMEILRILATCRLKRTMRVLFCNEEHTPWTSKHAADAAANRGDNIIAVLNVDSIGGKSDGDRVAGRLPHVVGYSTDEGKPLAEFVASCAGRFNIGIEPSVCFKEHVNDDDGMFIKAGFRTTVMNVGSFPYADTEYHLPGDVPERVDIANVVASTQLVLAAVLCIDEMGVPGAFG